MSTFAALPAAVDEQRPLAVSPLYRAIWRWHFYAGLLVIPFILLLAVTGGIYLFKADIDRTIFAYRNVVPAATTPQLTPSEIIARATAAVPGSAALSYREPSSSTSSAMVKVTGPIEPMLVWVNPYDGRILDTVERRLEFVQAVRKIHSLKLFGTYPERIIEAVGGFTLVLVVTGVFLWWPRHQTGGVVTVRGTPKRRVFWRDIHAVTGLFSAVLVLFLAASGMPWSGFWGNKLNEFASSIGAGYPPQVWDSVPTSTIPAGTALDRTSWSLEQSPMPLSSGIGQPIGVDKAVAIAKERGIAQGFELTLPADAEGVYTAQIFPDDLALDRTIHIDQYSGKPLVDLGYSDSGWIGRTVDFSVNIHMGQEWGRLNQAVMLATVLALIASAASAVVMWWKRRPSGRLGVPPMPSDRRVYIGLWIIAAIFGIAFPITGIAIIAMLAIDVLLIRTIPPLRRAFS